MATHPPVLCTSCAEIEVGRYKNGGIIWTREKPNLNQLDSELISNGSPLTIVIARAERLRLCETCHPIYTRTFRIPDTWWTAWCRRCSVYFGSEDTVGDSGELDGHSTWFRYDVKHVSSSDGDVPIYTWWKFNVFTRWDATTQSNCVLIMNPLTDLKDDLKDKYLIPKIEGRHLVIRENITSPYYAHVLFAEISLDIHHQAIWSIRDLVRNIEKERLAEDVQSPSSTRLTEGIRHAIHVSETCETTVHMVQAMLSAHELWLQQNTFPAYQPPVISTQPNKTAGHLNRIIPNLTNRHISSRLRHALSGLRTLQQRASSNHARLNSEIQLSTNTFSQSISIAAQEDSRIMKSLTYLGVIFLPATFMSALFSTSFFNTTNDTGEWYLHTDRFWIFWAVTVPVTLLAAGGMWAWSKFADSGGGGGKVVIYNSNTKVNTGLGTGGTGTGAGAVAVTTGGNDGGEGKGTWGMGMRMGMGMKRRSTVSYSWTTAKKKPGSGPGDEDGLGKS